MTFQQKENKEKLLVLSTQAAKMLLTSVKERGHLGRNAPPEKKKAVSEDQEGCRQTSQQTSPDEYEGEENAQENVWSDQAYHKLMMGIVHRMSMFVC